MKLSRYNVTVWTSDGCLIVYNTMSGALIRLQPPEATLLEARRIEDLPGNIVDGLIHGGFIVPTDLDEVFLCRYQARLNRTLAHEINLVVIPTTDCNFACPYCFSRARPEYMNDEVADKVLQLARKRVNLTRHLKVEWFGGEPLLALDRVLCLSSALQDMCAANGCRYTSTIVTNGFLLTRQTASRLQAAGITAAHVTIDGPQHIHDRTRVTTDGKPTFAQLWDNVREASREMNVFVRISTSVETYADSWSLYDDIQKNLSPAVPAYFALLHDSHELVADYHVQCQSGDSFMQQLFYDARQRLEAGDALRGLRLPFTGFSTGCIANQPLGLAVGPQGELYKCGKVVGRSECVVGSLFDRGPHAELLPRAFDWLNARASDHPDCDDCRYLPTCNGGCPGEWIKTKQKRCRPFDDFIDEMILTMDLMHRMQRGDSRAEPLPV